MRSSFDPRVVPSEVADVIRACQDRVRCRLGGGAALSGAYLGHRATHDVDLVCRHSADVRSLVRDLPNIADRTGTQITLVRDAGTFIRASVATRSGTLELDAVFEATPPIGEGVSLEGIAIESLADLRASKLTCILSRSEPRDLVDLLFLDRAGYHPENDLPLALQKDGGIDPGILAWLLGQFPLEPLPMMLIEVTRDDLATFRDSLRERFRKIAVPS
ncbi:MAG: nucleotidyl transferase AbiEii/AbiGii toxin family protein [Polyangiaceae bacterium]|nr:nucleotidyl transferase AbiEii/AbiGii toxin family protein [Polyangiaceae bacterium]